VKQILSFWAQSVGLNTLALSVLTLVLVSCAVNPVTGERQLSLVSAEQELAIGAQHYQPSQQAQGGRYLVDPDLNVYVNQVTQRLAEASDRPGLPYEVVVLNNGTPNAWALPGGKMAINRGLLVELEDEAQLASVMGHEIVHAAARHGASQQTRNILLQSGMLAAGLAADQANSNYSSMAMGALSVGAGAWQAQYSRSHELEADRYGIEYMARAGYDPQAAVELQETFVKLSQNRRSGWLDGLFASHPPSQERVEANRELAAQYSGGVRNKAAFDRAIRQLRQDQPAYDNYEAAQKAAADKDLDKAMRLVDQAINHQPRETLFWELKGRLLMEQGQNEDALVVLNHSVELNPEFFRPLALRGLAHKRLNNLDEAQRDLEASQALLPTQLTSFHLGELAQARGDRGAAIRHYQQAAQGGGQLGQAAQERLQQLGIRN